MENSFRNSQVTVVMKQKPTRNLTWRSKCNLKNILPKLNTKFKNSPIARTSRELKIFVYDASKFQVTKGAEGLDDMKFENDESSKKNYI